MQRIFLYIFLQEIGFGLHLTVAVLWQITQGLNIAEVALVSSVWWIASMIFEVPTGWLADRIGRKKSLVIGTILMALTFALTLNADSVVEFIISQLLFALGTSFLSGADEALIYDDLKSDGAEAQYNKIYSRYAVMMEIGTIIGSLLASFAIWKFELSVAYIWAIIFMSIAILVSTFVKEKNILQASEEIIDAQKESLRLRSKNFFVATKKYHFLIWLVFIFAFMGFSSGSLWQFQLLDVGVHAAQFGLLYAGLKIFSIAGSMLVGKLHHIEKKHIIGVTIIYILAFALASIPSLIVVLCAYALYYFIENVMRGIQTTYLNEHIPSQYRATILSVNSFVSRGTGALFIIALGQVGQRSLTMAFLCIVGIKILTLLLTLRKLPK